MLACKTQQFIIVYYGVCKRKSSLKSLNQMSVQLFEQQKSHRRGYKELSRRSIFQEISPKDKGKLAFSVPLSLHLTLIQGFSLKNAQQSLPRTTELLDCGSFFTIIF